MTGPVTFYLYKMSMKFIYTGKDFLSSYYGTGKGAVQELNILYNQQGEKERK